MDRRNRDEAVQACTLAQVESNSQDSGWRLVLATMFLPSDFISERKENIILKLGGGGM